MSLANRWRALRESNAIYPLLALFAVVVVVLLGPLLDRPRAAPEFTLPAVTAEGIAGTERMALRDHRGKVVLLDFWATWCRPCQASTPILARLYTRYKDRGLVVLGVNVDQQGPEVVPHFVRRFGVNYPIVYDSGQVSNQYGIQSLPTLMVIDRQGLIRHTHRGVESEEDLARAIEKYL